MENGQPSHDYIITNSKRGGKRDKITKVTKETLKCLITLELDFPTLSSFSYMTNLNSQFGPNYTNNISERTVQRYLTSLNFKLKKFYFSTPKRSGFWTKNISCCMVKDSRENSIKRKCIHRFCR